MELNASDDCDINVFYCGGKQSWLKLLMKVEKFYLNFMMVGCMEKGEMVKMIEKKLLVVIFILMDDGYGQ